MSVSKTVYDHVHNKLNVGYKYQGEHQFKNIINFIQVYRVLTEPEFAGKLIGEKRTTQPSEKPSIAVLPFENLSGDPEQEYFNNGITEDIITDLSKISGMLVISRHSTFTYKGKVIKIRDVGKELGVRYVLEGSVRKANDKVRINAQLVDATTEGYLWAERFDRDLNDIFTLQDEVTRKIVAALAIKLTRGEQTNLERKYTDNIEAYDYYLQGADYQKRFSQASNIKARQLFGRAIELDPNFAAALTALGFTYFHEWTFGWALTSQPLNDALKLAQKALDLDASLPWCHHLLGKIYLWKLQHERAITSLDRAVTLSPNDADQLAGLAYILNFSGKPDKAKLLIKKAMGLNPMYPAYYLWELGHVYILTGHYEKAIATLNRALNRSSDFIPAHVLLAASYIEIGNEEKARSVVAGINKLNPNTSLFALKRRLPYKDQTVLDQIFNNLRKAGIPEE